MYFLINILLIDNIDSAKYNIYAFLMIPYIYKFKIQSPNIGQ